MEQPEPGVTVSLSRKINLGNYESAEVFVSLTGLRAGATQEEMEDLLQTGSLAYGVLRRELAKQIALVVDQCDTLRLKNPR